MNNVVNAVFGATKKTKTGPIFQYDYGNKLQFVGVELPSSYEVHFSNYNYGNAKTVLGDSTGVEIPYEYTKNYGRVFAWVFIHENEDVGWTKYLAEIPVIQRAKPSYDPVDPHEQSIVEQLVSTVKGLQDDVSGVQDDVQTLQQTATQIATNTQNINDLNSAVKVVREDVATNTQDINDLNSAVEVLQGDVSGVQDDVETLQQTATQIATNTQNINDLNSAVKVVREDVADLQTDVSGVQEDVQTLQKKKADVIVSSASGSVAAFADGADDMPLESLKCYIEPVQDLNGYDNPWPAGGGKNLLTPKSNSTITSNGVTFTFNSDETIKITGTPTVRYTYGGVYGVNTVDVSQLYPLLTGLSAGGKMSLTIEENTTGIGLIAQFNKSNGTLAGSRFTESQLATTVFPDAEYMFVAVRVDLNAVTTPIDCTVKLQITNSDVAESWTPYSNICPISGWTEAKVYHSGEDTDNPDVLSVAFPVEAGMVYGGYMDVVKGELVVDRAILDMASITNWTVDKNAKRIYKIRQDLAPASAASEVADGLICNRFPSITENQIYGNVEGVAISINSALQFRINGLTDDANVTLAMVIEYFANNSTTVVAKLATPTTYTLTPQELNTLLGNNSIYCDTGDTEVSYPADTKLYIDGKIAELQALVLEN